MKEENYRKNIDRFTDLDGTLRDRNLFSKEVGFSGVGPQLVALFHVRVKGHAL
jgi:hypothetical protein